MKSLNLGYGVGCNYSGQNGFGGMTQNANWFVVKHETVVEVLPNQRIV